MVEAQRAGVISRCPPTWSAPDRAEPGGYRRMRRDFDTRGRAIPAAECEGRPRTVEPQRLGPSFVGSDWDCTQQPRPFIVGSDRAKRTGDDLQQNRTERAVQQRIPVTGCPTAGFGNDLIDDADAPFNPGPRRTTGPGLAIHHVMDAGTARSMGLHAGTLPPWI
jgi:hypothetical protein